MDGGSAQEIAVVTVVMFNQEQLILIQCHVACLEGLGLMPLSILFAPIHCEGITKPEKHQAFRSQTGPDRAQTVSGSCVLRLKPRL